VVYELEEQNPLIRVSKEFMHWVQTPEEEQARQFESQM
jgi:hypothetical protein